MIDNYNLHITKYKQKDRSTLSRNKISKLTINNRRY